MLRVRHDGVDAYKPINDAVFYKVSSMDSAIKINKLLRGLFAVGIQNVEIKDFNEKDKWSHVEVTVDLKKEQTKILNGAELYIPRILKFNIDARGITFDENERYAPCEVQDSCCGAWANRLNWWEISVKEDEYQFASPRWVGLGYPVIGGTPNCYSIPIENVLDAIRG